MEYYLVSFGRDPKGGSYWVLDRGDVWLDVLKNIEVPKEEGDIVKEAAKAPELAHLDWKKTPLDNPSSKAGWLSRYGRFWGCPSNLHDKHAYYVLGKTPSELENRGWVRVLDSKYYTYEGELNPEQRNWLSENGYKLYD